MSDLKDDQLLVFDKYIAGENIFITGPGGTGKTHIIKAIVKHATENNKVYKVNCQEEMNAVRQSTRRL